MELGTAKVLVQIKGTEDPLKAQRKDSLSLLSPVLLRRVTKTVSQEWLGDHLNVAGKILPSADKESLTQYMRSDTQEQ